MERRRVVVSGLVQGVFFRDGCVREATAAGVAGWVRNQRGGSVEAVFEGEPAAVERLVAWTRHGPEGADVSSMEVVEEEPEGLAGFVQR